MAYQATFGNFELGGRMGSPCQALHNLSPELAQLNSNATILHELQSPHLHHLQELERQRGGAVHGQSFPCVRRLTVRALQAPSKFD